MRLDLVDVVVERTKVRLPYMEEDCSKYTYRIFNLAS